MHPIFELYLIFVPPLATLFLALIVRELRGMNTVLLDLRRVAGRSVPSPPRPPAPPAGDPAVGPLARLLVERHGRSEGAARLATQLGVDGATGLALVERYVPED